MPSNGRSTKPTRRVVWAAIGLGALASVSACGATKSSSTATDTDATGAETAGDSVVSPVLGTPGGATTVLDVDMVDSKYSFSRLRVRGGSTITLRFSNSGLIQHEAVFGDKSFQAAHDLEMQAASQQVSLDAAGATPDAAIHQATPGQHVHEAEAADMGSGMAADMGSGMAAGTHAAVSLAPGQSGEMTFTVPLATEQKGKPELEVACHEPGHYNAGMILPVEIV